MKRPLLPFVSLTAVLLAATSCKRGGTGPTAAATNPPATTAGASSAPITAVPDKDRYKVTAATTGFFRYSPLAPGEIAQEDAATLQAAQAAAGAQLTAVTPVGNVPATTRNGKKSSAVEGSYTIPSAADINTRLPEPDARPKATPSPSPAVNFR